MLRQILLVSHGGLAEGIYEAASIIAGDLSNVSCLCVEKDAGIRAFKQNFKSKIDEIKDVDEIVVLADLRGGSPYNNAVSILSESGLLHKSKVFSGLNLPLFVAVYYEENTMDVVAMEAAVNAGREGVGFFQIEENNNEEL